MTEPATKISIDEQMLVKAMQTFKDALQPRVVYSEDPLEMAREVIREIKSTVEHGIAQLKLASPLYWKCEKQHSNGIDNDSY